MIEDDEKDIWEKFAEIAASIPEEDLASLHPALSQHDLGDLNDLLWARDDLRETIRMASAELLGIREMMYRFSPPGISFSATQIDELKDRCEKLEKFLNETLEKYDHNS